MAFRACGCVFEYWFVCLHAFGCVLHLLTYLSALTYSSSTGTQGTLPSLTPIWMSRNCRPRFSPKMVTLVPPWRGPVSGNNWTNKRMEDGGQNGRRRRERDRRRGKKRQKEKRQENRKMKEKDNKESIFCTSFTRHIFTHAKKHTLKTHYVSTFSYAVQM